MKKILSIALALSLSLSVTAFAEDATIKPGDNGSPNPPSADTTVEFSVDPAYTVTIPEKVELTRKEADDGTVTYEQEADITASAGVRLLEGQSIQVTLDGSFKLTTGTQGAKYELPYTVTVDNEEITEENNVVAVFGTSLSGQSSTLHFAADDPVYAGSYSGIVTFNISIVTADTAGQ